MAAHLSARLSALEKMHGGMQAANLNEAAHFVADAVLDIPFRFHLRAAERLVALGFARVFNMIESFEGEADPKTKYRTVNGWKNRGLPYTYDLDPKLLWPPR